jgi:predicted DNA-binding transcriptional regulator AlpA
MPTRRLVNAEQLANLLGASTDPVRSGSSLYPKASLDPNTSIEDRSVRYDLDEVEAWIEWLGHPPREP